MTENTGPRIVTVLLVDRANYARLRPVMKAVDRHPDLALQVVCTGTMLLDRFGRAVEVVRRDGFEVNATCHVELEGSTPGTMAQSIGLATLELASIFRQLDQDFVLIVGDRYEALAGTLAAVYQNINVIHLQGGEVSGSIDESTRHAITKLAHFHFPATEKSARNLVRMGERPSTVFPFGCPSADVVAAAVDRDLPQERLERFGVGPELDFSRPFLVVTYHPVTTEYSATEAQTTELLEALRGLGLQTLLVWPNIDAGADGVSQAIRRFREFHPDHPLRAYKNFEPEEFVPLLGRAACLVGNSSSFLRDASFLGTPVVLVGSRQRGRERGPAVVEVAPRAEEITAAVQRQIDHGRYPPSAIYGRPGVSERIAEQVARLEPYGQKSLSFEEPDPGQRPSWWIGESTERER